MINQQNLNYIANHREILIHEDNFIYLLPCQSLKSLISNFTISFPTKSIISDDYTIMPHGSVTLVFFNNASGLHSWLFGPTTKPHKVGDIANKCDILFIIEFQPAGFSPFIKINQKELTNQIIPFSVIHDDLDKKLKEILKNSFSVEQLLQQFEEELIQNIQFYYPKELTIAIETIIQAEGMMTSLTISNHSFYSSRHLNRLFNLYLGMSMKAFSRLVRINKSLQLLNEKKTLTFICDHLGFYDVSHFIKDFKTVCGITPQEYKAKMSDFYSEIAKF